VAPKNEDSASTRAAAEAASILHRIANLLALLLVTGKPQPEQISLLNAAGYSPG